MSTDAAPLSDDVALYHQIIRGLQREVAELKARLNQDSSNYSKIRSPVGQACAAEAAYGKEAWWALVGSRTTTSWSC
jgi:hypothetical protein